MSTGIDIRYVQETYQRMSDEQLIRIATQDAHGLTPEAIEVVKAEIKKRGFDDNILKGVEAQNKRYTIEDVDSYCDIIRMLNCPFCDRSTEKLNATITGEVVSFIILTQYKKRIKIGCPDCLDKANNDALTTTLLLGWWGIPWGVIMTVQSIFLNLKSKRTNHLYNHSDYFRSFALSIIGELETYKDDRATLQQILKRQNSL